MAPSDNPPDDRLGAKMGNAAAGAEVLVPDGPIGSAFLSALVDIVRVEHGDDGRPHIFITEHAGEPADAASPLPVEANMFTNIPTDELKRLLNKYLGDVQQNKELNVRDILLQELHYRKMQFGEDMEALEVLLQRAEAHGAETSRVLEEFHALIREDVTAALQPLVLLRKLQDERSHVPDGLWASRRRKDLDRQIEEASAKVAPVLLETGAMVVEKEDGQIEVVIKTADVLQGVPPAEIEARINECQERILDCRVRMRLIRKFFAQLGQKDFTEIG